MMNTKWPLHLTRLSTLILVICLFHPSSFAQDGPLVKNCKGQVYREQPNASPMCQWWVVQWRKRSTGKVWGSATYRTREEAIQDTAKTIKNAHDVARMFKEEFDYERRGDYSEPNCHTCGSGGGAAEGFDWNTVCKRAPYMIYNGVGRFYGCSGAISFFEAWGVKIGNWIGQMGVAWGRGTPPMSVGTVLWDWATGTRDAARRVNEMQDRVAGMTDPNQISAEFERMASELDRLDAKYKSLPQEARDWLEGRVRVEIDGYWKSDEGSGFYIRRMGSTLQMGIPVGDKIRVVMTGTISENIITVPDAGYAIRLTNSSECGLGANYVVRGRATMQGTIFGDTVTLTQNIPEFTLGACTFPAMSTKKVWQRSR